jgi:hypothetical protein
MPFSVGCWVSGFTWLGREVIASPGNVLQSGSRQMKKPRINLQGLRFCGASAAAAAMSPQTNTIQRHPSIKGVIY